MRAFFPLARDHLTDRRIASEVGISLVVQVVFWLLVCTSGASAQRYYSFEEACRMGGWTTGPCAPKSQLKRKSKRMNICGSAFHAARISGCEIEASLSPVTDLEIFTELIGIPNISKINELRLGIFRSKGIRNAIASFHNGQRVIVYDPEWARGGSAESYLVFGHEAGHHFCKHTIGGGASSTPHERELEADRFAGASIKRLEVYHGKLFLKDVLEAAARLYSISGSRAHPPRSARIRAILQGYNSGSPCGSLASGVPGFSRWRR